jgi:hypothetical protein
MDYEEIAMGVRAGSIPASEFTHWLLARSEFWFIAEGDLDAEGRLVNGRPLVVSHPSGANVSLVFIDRARAEAYRSAREELKETHVVCASPVDSFETLQVLRIDGFTINPGEESHLNAGRLQLDELARLAREAAGEEPEEAASR